MENVTYNTKPYQTEGGWIPKVWILEDCGYCLRHIPLTGKEPVKTEEEARTISESIAKRYIQENYG